MHLVTEYTRSPVHHTRDDQHLVVLRRVGGPSDTHLPRYFMGLGPTRHIALDDALTAARTRCRVDLEHRASVREQSSAA